MRSSSWGVLCVSLVASLVAGGPIVNSPSLTTDYASNVVKRADVEPSSYPYGLASTNEFSWLGWDPNNAAQRAEGEIVHRAFGDMVNMIYFAWKEADAKSDIFKRWFAESDSENVKKVLERIVDTKGIGNAVPMMKDWILLRDDTKNACKAGKGGYSIYNRGRFHLCPEGISRPRADTMTCADLEADASNPSNKYSNKKIKSVAFTLMHEATHWDKVGDAALNKHISDSNNAAGECSRIRDEAKLVNAQNYAFLGAEAYMKAKGCTFINPPPGASGTDDPFDGDIFEPPSTPPSKPDTKALNIIRRSYVNKSYYENQWFFYMTPFGTSALCRHADTTLAKFPMPNGLLVDLQWPAGDFKIEPDGMDCNYKNDGTDAGALWCKGRDVIGCKVETKRERKECMDYVYQTPYVKCEWS